MAQYYAAVHALASLANRKAAELAALKLGPRKDPVRGYNLAPRWTGIEQSYKSRL
jgi:hypothetical protein